MALYTRHIRPRLRQALARTLPGPVRARRRIAVVGLPRSGSSWLARALSLAPGVAYYFEPERELGPAYYYAYRGASDSDPALLGHVRRSLAGRVVQESAIAEHSLDRLAAVPFAGTVLLKWVRLSLCLEWLNRHFPDLMVVQIVRHPVPQFLSWQARGWNPGRRALSLLLEQEALMDGPLRPFAGVMRSAESYWERAGAFWGAVAHLQWRSHRPRWVLAEHEWYCLDPESRIRGLVECLGLEWGDRIAEFLRPDRARSSGPGYGRRRDPRDEIHKWQGRITALELRELESVLRIFDLPFYPGLDPEASWRNGASPPDRLADAGAQAPERERPAAVGSGAA